MDKELKKREIKKVVTATEVKNVEAILVTAAEPEKKAVLSAMDPIDGDSLTIALKGRMSYEIGYFGKYKVAHVHCDNQGGMGEGSLVTVWQAMKDLNAKACIMIGIAYGANEGQQDIGDVLISKCIQSYESVRVSTDENGKVRYDDRNKTLCPGETIKNIFTNFDFPEHDYRVFPGTILSGEKLIDNAVYKNMLITKFQKTSEIVGGEMEGVGLASALKHLENDKWIMVKAICDWADGNKKSSKKERQELAAKNATEFCKKLFETKFPQEIGLKISRERMNKRIKKIVNPYVLFYYRNKRMVSFRKLSEVSKVSEEVLRDCEKENEKNEFVKIPLIDIESIRNCLDCGDEISKTSTDEYMVKFYKKYKGRGRFYPVNNSKAIVFDFDGTLTRVKNNHSSWQLIWLYLNYTLDDCGRFYRKFASGDITHQEWCDITARYFSQRDFKVTDMEAIAREVTLVEGAIETLMEIKEKGVKLYICSGAMNDLIKAVLGNHTKLFEEIQSNEFTYNRNGFLNGIRGTLFDFKGKADYIVKVIKDNNINPDECMFIGNSDNDVWAHESGAKTLVVNPRKINGMNRTEWKYYIENMEDLHQILPFIFPEDDL